MHQNKIICFICKNEITSKQLLEAEKFKDANGDIKYRHKRKTRGCKINFKLKPLKHRKSPTLNKRGWIKKSDKIYNRKKEKQQFNKDLTKEF